MYIIRPERLPFGEHKFLLQSDIHIGSPETDYKLVEKELAWAKKNKARVRVNGDIFDAIVPADSKKYRPDAVHRRLRGRADILNEGLKWAVELYSPVADLLDVLGSGNHDDWLLKNHSIDLVRMLCDALGRPELYGGYTGFIDNRFSDDSRHSQRCVMWYHHGSGSGTSLGGAAGQFTKMMQYVDADIVWVGHKHFPVSAKMRRLSCPLGGHKPRLSDVRYVMSGSYLDCWTGDRGPSRRASYAEDKALPPQGKGGTILTINASASGLAFSTEVR